jgi:glycosyltransferase involved in cell wall biosynthesis
MQRSFGNAAGVKQVTPLRVGILLGHPTQFEGPFFRYAERAGGAKLTVMYLSANESSEVFDPELGRTVGWGIDLLGGYDYKKLPASGWVRWLWGELRPAQYDCIIINGYSRAPYLVALAIAKLRGIRVALRIDSVMFNNSAKIKRAYKRAAYAVLLSLYDKFFATGTLAREYLLHFGVEPRRIALFPYTVDTEYFRSLAADLSPQREAIRRRYGIPEGTRVILAIVKLSAREAPWDLLLAIGGLDRQDCWTLVVGDGDQRGALETFVREQQTGHVVFTGYVPYADLVSMYVAADVFVHAVGNEPWGVSVHEAIACGLPVVASSRVGAAYDLIKPGRNGYMYEFGNSNDLREKLLLVLDRLNPDEVQKANQEILNDWNYMTTWHAVVDGCQECVQPENKERATEE